MTATVRVLVADDKAPFRRAARAVVAMTPGFDLVAEAASGEEALALAASLAVDLVLIDVDMPGIGGIEAARRISGPVTVLVSTYRERDLPVRARSCGATAYVRKEDFGTRVLQAVWDAASPARRRGTAAPP